MTTESPTPTPLDLMWLQTQIGAALASAGTVPTAHISLPLPMVQLVAGVIEQHINLRTPTRATRYDITPEDLRAQVISELQRLATHGEAPSKSRWNEQRRYGLPTATHATRLVGESWQSLVAAAGLQLNSYARRYGADDDLAEEPSKSAAGSAVLEPEDYAVLNVSASRTEVSTAGNVRITRTYHTIR